MWMERGSAAAGPLTRHLSNEQTCNGLGPCGKRMRAAEASPSECRGDGSHSATTLRPGCGLDSAAGAHAARCDRLSRSRLSFGDELDDEEDGPGIALSTAKRHALVAQRRPVVLLICRRDWQCVGAGSWRSASWLPEPQALQGRRRPRSACPPKRACLLPTSPLSGDSALAWRRREVCSGALTYFSGSHTIAPLRTQCNGGAWPAPTQARGHTWRTSTPW